MEALSQKDGYCTAESKTFLATFVSGLTFEPAKILIVTGERDIYEGLVTLAESVYQDEKCNTHICDFVFSSLMNKEIKR